MEKIKSPLAFLNNNQIRAFLFQVIILVLIASFFYSAAGNLLNNIESRGIHTGFVQGCTKIKSAIEWGYF
jgi:ABC-type amino acid transport system permease subunit